MKLCSFNMRSAYIAAAAIVAAPMLSAPLHAQVTVPSQGVVCDQRGRVCYDSQGVSMGLTQDYFGPQAVQNLLNQLQGGPAPTEFRLSSGVACSSAARTCWSDGWSRQVVDWSLTSQLYGRSGGSGDSGNASAGRPERASGYCSLSRLGRPVFNGGCELKKVVRGGKTRFEAALGNGQLYTFVTRNGSFVIQDDTGGSWPVSFQDRGTTGVFQWNDLQLIATRTSALNGGGSGGSSAGTSAGSAQGNAAGAALGAGIGALLNSLFK
jgi:hypothetical protein